jgi:hypothetical protein
LFPHFQVIRHNTKNQAIKIILDIKLLEATENSQQKCFAYAEKMKNTSMEDKTKKYKDLVDPNKLRKRAYRLY